MAKRKAKRKAAKNDSKKLPPQEYKAAIKAAEAEGIDTGRDTRTFIDLFPDNEIDMKYLDLGFAGDHWYYGINIDGREAIIMDDKKVYRNTLVKMSTRNMGTITTGENEIKDFFEYSGYIGDIAPRWTNQSIRSFLSGKKNNKNDVANRIKKMLEFFMDFGEYPQMSSVQTCWILGTYCYPLFYWFPHIFNNAPSGSGKTKNAYLQCKLSFGGYDLGASAGVTPATIFRTIEGNRGTLLIDEFERRDDSESQVLVNQILNASCGRDAYVIRTEQINRKWKAWKFPIFCPKIVCNITGINPTSLSRFIPFHLLKTKSKKGKNKPQREKYQAEYQEIRDDCHILIMQEWDKIQKIYDTIEVDLSNRDEDNWLPILSIAKWLGQDYYDDVISYINCHKTLEIDTGDLTETLFITIYSKVSENEDLYKSSEIANWLIDDLKSFKSPASWVGRTLKKYKFQSIRRGPGSYFSLSKSNVKNIIDRYFCTEQATQATLHTQDTQDTQDTCVASVACVASVGIGDMPCNCINNQQNGAKPVYNSLLQIFLLNPDLSFAAEDLNVILKECNISCDLDKELECLSKNGDIYQIKPGCWRLLS